MLVARAPLKLSALPAGLAFGACLWILVGGANLSAEIGQLQTRLSAADRLLRLDPSRMPVHAGLIAQERPLFALASTGNTGEPSLVLEGVSLGAGGKGALVAIGGARPIWLEIGESRSGVTLRRVDGLTALVETVSGDHSLTLGSNAAGGSPTPSSGVGAQVRPPTPTSTR